MELYDVFPKTENMQRLYCDNCGDYLDLWFPEFHKEVSGVDIHIMGLPELFCDKCSVGYLPEDSRFAIIYLHEQAIKHGKNSVNIIRNKINQNFGFTQVPFLYDSDDFKYFPGLKRPWNEGFLTPVFFNKSVLLKYDSSPTYRLKFVSTTYGEIRQGEQFSISYGLNKNGKVIMWLGDIASLPIAEQYYLRSENIESDHSIGSEFYDGQIECKFTNYSKETKLFQSRSNFLESCFKRFGKKLAHLDEEVLEIAIGFNAPIVDTEKDRRHIADTLNKIYLESFDKKVLGDILCSLGGKADKLGSNKLLQGIMERIAGEEDISNIMSPFYVLYDLRVAYSHLGSNEGGDKKLKYVQERLGLDESAKLQEIYEAVVSQLSTSFNRLTAVINDEA